MRVLVWAGAFASVIYWIVLFARSKWQAVRASMLVVPPKVLDLQKPGLIGENLNAIQWTMAVRTNLERAVRVLEQSGNSIGKAAADAVRAIAPVELSMAELTRSAAVRTLQTGQLQSLLAKSEQVNFYGVVFPGRHEHARLFRRYPPFMDGWLDHVARLRAGLAAEGNTLPILCLLYFLSPNAQGGVLLLAYEADAGRMVPGDLLEENEDLGANSFRCSEKFEFQLTYSVGKVLSPGVNTGPTSPATVAGQPTN